MATKARQALAANLATLSQSLELAAPAAETPLNITIGSPTRRGARDTRALDPTAGRGSEASHRPVLIRDMEQTGDGRLQTFLRNVAQYLGSSAGIQTKRMREDYELMQSEAGQAYADQEQSQVQLAGTTFDEIGADALRLESFGNSALDEQAENLRRDAAEAHWQFENFRDPEMRAAALERLQEVRAAANTALDSHVNAGLTEARTFAREELKDLRRSISVAQGAFSERKASSEGMLARMALIGSGEIKESSPEGQAILTEAFESMQRYQDSLGGLVGGVGQALGAVTNPLTMAAGAAVSAVGSVLAAENAKLSYSDVLKAFQAQQDALDRFAYGDGQEYAGYLPQLAESLSQREAFARDRLGIPIDESWRSTQFEFPRSPTLPAQTVPQQTETTIEEQRSRAYQTIPRRVR
jgi:DNA-binding transcriptional regulator YiaG